MKHLPAVVLFGLLYLIAGLVFGSLAGRAASHQWVVLWRLAAWVISALAFGTHILYEQVRLRSSPKVTALYVAAAAGLGAFGLAAAANIHSVTATAPGSSRRLLLALAVWPVMTMLPAFGVALVAAYLLARVRRVT